MKWTVIWKPLAERTLAELWNENPARQELTDAANRIDALLKHSADIVGESREGNRRILLEPPLGVVYEVNELDRTVTVLAVWQLPAGS